MGTHKTCDDKGCRFDVRFHYEVVGSSLFNWQHGYLYMCIYISAVTISRLVDYLTPSRLKIKMDYSQKRKKYINE